MFFDFFVETRLRRFSVGRFIRRFLGSIVLFGVLDLPRVVSLMGAVSDAGFSIIPFSFVPGAHLLGLDPDFWLSRGVFLSVLPTLT